MTVIKGQKFCHTLEIAQPVVSSSRFSSLLLGTALSAIVGMGYGRGAYGQTVISTDQTATQSFSSPGNVSVADDISIIASSGSAVDFTIRSNGSNGDIGITTGAGVVLEGADEGIHSYHDKDGNISITTGTNSFVTGGRRGIYAYQGSGGYGDISINVGSESEVTGTNGDGVEAKIYLSGNLVIKTESDSKVRGGDNGINAFHESNGGETGDLTVSTGSGSLVEGANFGIKAENLKDTGDISVTTGANSSVVGGLDGGIYARRAYGSSSDLTITTGVNSNISVGASPKITNGILALQEAIGALTIDLSAGTTISNDSSNTRSGAIYASHSSIGDISVTSDSLVSLIGGYGINVRSVGRGDVSVNLSGTITSVDTGINATTASAGNPSSGITRYGGSVVVNFDGSITAEYAGVGAFARNGSIDIDVAGEIIASGGSSGFGYGILVRGSQFSNAANSQIAITTASSSVVAASRRGLNVFNYHDDTTITIGASSTISGGVDGIFVSHGLSSYRAVTGDIAITTGANSSVSGVANGILASHFGTGDIDINVGGAVIGDLNGITANQFGDGALAITTGEGSLVNTISAGSFGTIFASHSGADSIEINVNGSVSGGPNGIYAGHAGTGDVEITVGSNGEVIGSQKAFLVYGSGTGTVILRNFGTVTGAVEVASSNSNRFTNTGRWNAAGLTSNFNATGNSHVVNEGLIVAATGIANEITTLDNLDIFRNDAGGIIRLADGVAGDEFRIANTSSGTVNFIANGGVIELDVNLSGLNSSADKLVIAGDVLLGASWPTALRLSTAAASTGQAADEILVVDVTGSSDADSFVLANSELGAFVYNLSLGDCSAASGQSWYLCSTGQVGSTAALFDALPSVLLGTFGKQDSLAVRTQQRLSTSTAVASSEAQSDYAVGPWLRVFGDYAEVTPKGSTSGASWTARNGGLQFGIDEVVSQLESGILIAGAYLSYGTVGANIRNNAGTGRIDAEGYGIGSTLTWYGDTGFYADLAASLDRISTDAHTSGSGTVLNGQTNRVYTVSGEIGHRFSLENGIALVPQAQLTWSSVTNRDFSDALGNSVSLGRGETVIGRVGLAMEHSIADTGSGDVQLYGFGNLLHDFSGNSSVTYAGTNLTQTGTNTWGEIGAGVSLMSNEGLNIYAQGAYRYAFSGVSGHGLSGSVGLQMRW